MQNGEVFYLQVTELVIDVDDVAWVQHPTLGKKRIVKGTLGAEGVLFRVGKKVYVTMNEMAVIVAVYKSDPRVVHST